ncbi:MAG: M23 family metallopeptidase, partial [Vicinamibacterales bacterium]|nr:M23 family metallopeptidase [Vicinamibacterales bacterium]
MAVLLASVTLWGGVRGAQAAWEALKPEPPAVVSVTVPPKATPVTRSYTLKKGDTFAGGLQALGVPNAGGVVQAAMSAHNVANVRAGDVLEVLTSGDEAAVPLAVTYNVSQDETLRVDLQAKGGPQARLDTLTYSRKPVRKTFTVEGTLWGAAIEAGLSPGDVANLVSVFEYDVDFQTELQPGADFTVVVDALYDDDGEFNRHEGLHAVKLVNRDKTYTGFRFEHANKDIAWYDKDGRQRAKPFLRNPLPFLRVTSKFSYRTDPMSRKRRFHGGVDLAASTGTPVRATGSGVIEVAS